MANSHSQYKDKAKSLNGVSYGVNWSIDVFLTAEGQYVAEVKAGGLKMETKPADDIDQAVAFGGMCLNDYFDDLGVGNAA